MYIRLPYKKELILLVVLMLAMMSVAAYCTPHLVAWTDEVQFADPAFSLYLGQGFTSSAWPYQRSDEFFIGNAPLFSLLLSIWMDIVGTDIFALHALNWGLAVVGAGLVWFAWVRINSEISPLVRVPIILTLLAGNGITFSYFSLRYDVLGFALLALAFYASTMRGRIREYLLALSGFLVFLAGFHLVVAVSMAISGFVFLCRNTFRQWLSLIVGMVGGGVFWLAIVAWHGLFKKFFLVTFGSQHVISGQLGQLVMQGDRGLIEKLHSPLKIYSEDPSLLIMMACFLVGYFLVTKMPGTIRSDSYTGRVFLILTLLMPLGLFLIGKFPIYYTWLAYIPCCLLCGEIWHSLIKARGKFFAVGLLSFCVVSASLGYLRIVDASLGKDSQDYYVTAPGLKTWLRKDDWVYSSFSAYFAVRPYVERVIVPTYGKTHFVPGIPEKDRISVVLVPNEEFNQTVLMLGGKWQQVTTMQKPARPLKLGDLVLARRIS